MRPCPQPFSTQPQSKFPGFPASCHQSHTECNLWVIMLKCSSLLKEIYLHYCWPRFTLSTWKVPQLSGHGFVPKYLETVFPEAHLGSRELVSRISDYSPFLVKLERAWSSPARTTPWLCRRQTPPPNILGGASLSGVKRAQGWSSTQKGRWRLCHLSWLGEVPALCACWFTEEGTAGLALRAYSVK